MPSLSFVLVVSACGSLLVAQSPTGAAIADALGRGDHAAARELAAAEPELPRRALLEAALEPLARRPAAMLAVAQRFPGHPAGGTALQAGLAAVVVLQGRGEAIVAGLRDPWEGLGDVAPGWPRDPAIDVQLAAVIPQLLARHARWEAEHADDPMVPLLRHLARLCACQTVVTTPLPVEPEAGWPVPRGLVDDLLVSVRPLGDAVPDLVDAVALLDREPTTRWLIAAKDAPAELRCPPAGRWLLEVQSLQAPWRSVRIVDVTALATILLVDEGALAFAVRAPGGFDEGAAPSWSLWSGAQRQAGGAQGEVGVWRLGREHVGSLVVQTRSGDQRARTDVYVPRIAAAPRTRHVAHWQFDRPLHRPGERLRGRVVVRSIAWTGEGLSAVPVTAPWSREAVSLRCAWPGVPAQTLALATDERGLAAFDVPIPEAATPGDVPVQLLDGAGLVLDERSATTIASFRRPALVAAIAGPQRVDPRDGLATVTVRVQWASGGPAAGVAVDVVVAGGRERETRRLLTTSDGSLAIPIACQGRLPGPITCDCEVQGVDGHVERLSHAFLVGEPGTPREPTDELRIDVPAEVVVGTTAALTVHGSPYTNVLAVVGRGQLARAESLWLGSSGTTVWEVEVTAADWPRLDVAVGTRDPAGLAFAHATTRQRAAAGLALDVPATVRPRERVVCRVRAGRPSLVTLAVADDRIFRLVADPTRSADESLRPWVEMPSWRIYHSDEPADGRRILGELLVDGRVPGPCSRVRPSPGAGGAAGPSGPSAGAAVTRVDFRATACFVTVATDADGKADVPIDLPDDVTTWRITATAVDERGEGALAVATLAARLPLAAEPLLPRLLRRGDRVEVPFVLDRARGDADEDRVDFAVAASGALQVVAGGEGQRRVGAGTAVAVACELAAVAVGDGTLRCAAAAGAASDRSERRLPVLADVVPRALTAAGAGKGTLELDLAPLRPADPGQPLQVVVLAGGAAAWQQLAQRLEAYPYGCVEQTLSRLLPFAAARLLPAAGHRADAGQDERLGKGMARLRQLQVARGGAFAWWPGQAADAGMTGLVLHGLAVLRAGGLDPAAYGIVLDAAALGDRWRPAVVADAGGVLEPAARVDAVELLSGLLRLQPDHADLRAAAAQCVDAAAPLPRGAWLRLGLALAAAGDAGRARGCLAAPPPGHGARAWFPGEDPLVVLAQEIELRRALGETIAADAEVRLLRELLAGTCRTYADGAALVALAPSLRPAAGPVAIEVTVDDGAATAVAIVPEQGAQWRGTVPAGRRCVVRCRDGDQLLFVQASAVQSRAAVGAGWAEPFVVDRRVLAKDAAGAWRAVAGELRVGERLRVRTIVRSPDHARYVAVVCALPAGFEVVGDDATLQRFDDRVVATVDRLVPGADAVVEFDVVPTLPGRVLWPPAVANAMYEPAAQGGSEGAVWTVQKGPSAPGDGKPFLVRAPVPAKHRAPDLDARTPPMPQPTPFQRATAACGELAELWAEDLLDGIQGFDDELDDAGRQRVAAAFVVLRELLDVDAHAVGSAIARAAIGEAGSWSGGTLVPWRSAMLAQLAEIRQRCLQLELLHVERQLGGRERVDTLASLLAALPPGGREAAALRLLRCAWPDLPGPAEDVLRALAAPLGDEALVAFVATMLASAADDLLDQALRVLPESAWSSLPPTARLDLACRCGVDAWRAKVLASVVRTGEGVRELVRRAREPGFADHLEPALWPDEVLLQLPWSSFAGLAHDDAPRTVQLLARGVTPTAELWRLLLQRDEGLPWSVVVAALRQRGPFVPPEGVVPEQLADPSVRTLVLSLLAADDASRWPAAVAAARGLQSADRDEAVDAAFGAALARCGSAAQVVEFAGWLPPDAWALLWRRLDDAGARLVLSATTARLHYGLPPGDDVLVAMLAHADEWRSVDEAVAAVLADPAGEARLRGVVARLPEPLASRVREEVADRLGLAPATLQPLADPIAAAPGLAALRGWGGTWPPHLAASRERLLRLRGLW